MRGVVALSSRQRSLVAAAVLAISAGFALAISRAGDATDSSALGSSAPTKLPFIKGHSWGWAGSRGDYASPEAAVSMKRLAETNADWVCIAFGAAMEKPSSTHIRWGNDNPRMVTDDEIRGAIQLARNNGLKVILKPTVNCDDSTWRAWIKFYRPITAIEKANGITGELDPWGETSVMREGEVTDLAQWAQWWKEFDAYLLHYAQLASETNCEMLCLGCEMNSTEKFEKEWRSIIGRIRERYQGLITYDVNHDREREVAWWDAVDVIGVSAYYHVSPPPPLTEEEATQYTTGGAEIVAELHKMRDVLADIHREYKKPILFIETGVTNVRGCARYPWAHIDEREGDPLDQQEQANYYQAMFDVFWNEPWFAGFCWWDWPARLYDKKDAAANRSFCIYGKEAEEIVRKWYAKNR